MEAVKVRCSVDLGQGDGFSKLGLTESLRRRQEALFLCTSGRSGHFIDIRRLLRQVTHSWPTGLHLPLGM